MISCRSLSILVTFYISTLIAGCAIGTGVTSQKGSNSASWHGRLFVRVDADSQWPPSQGQSFGSAFELQGNAQQGDLLLLTPLGNTAAMVNWTPAAATLRAGGVQREFKDLSHLIENLFGTPVPVSALFAWLNGQNVSTDGWEVDLSNRSQGSITARRRLPAPAAELRLVLEQ